MGWFLKWYLRWVDVWVVLWSVFYLEFGELVLKKIILFRVFGIVWTFVWMLAVWTGFRGVGLFYMLE